MRRTLCLALAVVLLSACAGGPAGGYVTYDPNRCDRSGDESQRRAC